MFLAALAQMWPYDIYQKPFDDGQQTPWSWIGVSGGGDFWPVLYQHSASGHRRDRSGIEHAARKNFLLVDTPDEALPSVWRLVLATMFGVYAAPDSFRYRGPAQRMDRQAS